MSRLSKEYEEEEESIVIGEDDSMRLSYLQNIEQEFYNKPYKIERGRIIHKRIKYTNVHKRVLILNAITDQPNLIQFKNVKGAEFRIDHNQSDYIRLKISPPNNPCIIIARVALLDHLDSNQVAYNEQEKDSYAIANLKQKMIEGLEFRIEVI